MDGYGGGDTIQDSSKIQDLRPFGENPSGNALFDASQYEFFGSNVVEEVELGGLEDEDDGVTPVGFTEEEFLLDKDEGGLLGLHSDIDDLSSTFSKLAGPAVPGVGRDWGSQQSSSAAELARDADFTNWFDAESNKWPSHGHIMEPDSLYRTSSFPDQQPEQQHLLPRKHEQNFPPFTSYPPPGGRSQQGQTSHPNNILHLPTPMTAFAFPNSQLQFNALQHGGNLPRGLHDVQNQWVTENHSSLPNKFPPHQNGMMPLQSQQIRMKHPSQSSVGQIVGFQSPQLMNPQPSHTPDLRNQRAVSLLKRQGMNYPHQDWDSSSQSWRPRFKFKYMSQYELENIHRMQLAAIHCDDPYIEDYYHQACLYRKSAGAKLRHHFCPSKLLDSSSNPRGGEPHPFLQVDALGRVAFSSLRRPRPLVEVDSPSSSDGTETRQSLKPLAHEPLFAVREMIEDGFNTLLDVDDIDRFVQFNQQLQDGGAELRHRRQVLLEDLASSLELAADPLGKSPKDDLVFLRLVSLPKGTKLLLRYLKLLLPGELTGVVMMAIFRNLRFLFGNLPRDVDTCLTSVNLATAVSSCVNGMELKALAGCLASVVCSQEHLPLRPVGSAAGDGASVILKGVLERATEVLTGGGNCSEGNRAFWQASFDAFFGVLTRYCFSKYDSGVGDVSKEMPVELLRASLPHTTKEQRKIFTHLHTIKTEKPPRLKENTRPGFPSLKHMMI